MPSRKGIRGSGSPVSPSSAAATKDATSSRGAKSAAPSDTTLDVAIGKWVRIETIRDETIEGQVYAFDSRNGMVILQCPSAEVQNAAFKKLDMRVLSTQVIKRVLVLSSAPTKVPDLDPSASTASHRTLLPVGVINWEQSAQREAAATRVMQAKLAKIGVGVGKDAQGIFDALSKTMECRWHEQTIVVMDSVIISSPYRPQDCKSNDDRALNRVQKVLEGERRKLGLASS